MSSGSGSSPFVSILTPTFNRRAWIPQLVRSVFAQTWLRRKGRRAEWIVLDDGTDPVGELLAAEVAAAGCPASLHVRYERPASRLPLGEKRNRLHALARGDIMVYFDDDDYHFPDRIEHSVQVLARHPRALAAGCSELPVWFLPENTLHVFGPYGSTHATCGTMAVRRQLGATRSFDPDARFGEEPGLLDDWRVNLVQLDPWRVILCIAHGENTVDKRAVRDRLAARQGGADQGPRAASGRNPARIVRDAAARAFYRAMFPAKDSHASGSTPASTTESAMRSHESSSSEPACASRSSPSASSTAVSRRSSNSPLPSPPA
jgi:glycosyltransferase involved in cell wall biosynthesis